ncbi:MAG: helix-turn-helix domain-containing protein, partial [Candidatus Limnocylindrales bacterium]
MLTFDADRSSDSPFVERVWRSHSAAAGTFVSIAESRAEFVIATYGGRVTAIVRGPETRATRVPYPPDTQWLGIRFRPGALLLPLPAASMVDGKATLSPAASDSFRLDGATWQVPTFDNADTFVQRLVRAGLLDLDPAVSAALEGELTASSPRTVQRRFLRATGVTRSLALRIERAR